MTAPPAFLVDQNSTITPHVNVTVDSAGAPTINTVDSSGNPVATGVGGGGTGTVKKVNSISPDGSGNVSLALANLSDGAAQQTAITAAGTAAAAAQSTATAAATSAAGKISVPLAWTGTVPALSSGTNPVTAGFGSNSFVYTGSGTSPALDGVTGQNGDVFIFGVGATTTWSVTPKHDPSAVLSVGGQTPTAGNVSLALANLSDGAAQQSAITAATNGVATLTAASTVLADNSQSGTTYTLMLADAGQNVDMTNASANTVTIPKNTTVAFPVNTIVTVTQAGAGTTSIAAATGVTIVKPSTRTLAISTQYETAELYYAGSDTWRVRCG